MLLPQHDTDLYNRDLATCITTLNGLNPSLTKLKPYQPTNMSQQNSTSRPPPPMRVLNALELGVKSAKTTHRFLCDVFGQPNSEAPSQLSTDQKRATFALLNTTVVFITATPSMPSGGEQQVSINLLIKDIGNVKKVLDEHNHKYKPGQWKDLPGQPHFVQFLDLDGYTWIVGEFSKE